MIDGKQLCQAAGLLFCALKDEQRLDEQRCDRLVR